MVSMSEAQSFNKKGRQRQLTLYQIVLEHDEHD
jgi:hypothetical protein